MSSSKFKTWGLLILLALIWGSSFILMKRGLFDSGNKPLFNFMDVAAYRLFIAGLFLSPIALFRILKLRAKHWPWVIVVGFIGNGIPAFLFALAQTQVDSGITGILNSLTPLFTFILGVFIFGSKFTRIQLFGILLGMIGATGLIISNTSPSGSINFYGLLVVIATICYATSINIIRNKLSEMKSLDIAAIALFLLMIPTGIYLLNGDFIFVLEHHDESMKGLGYLTILGVVGTALALVLYNQLIKATSAIFASSVTYIIPLVAMMWGVFDNEVLNSGILIFGTIIISAIYMINNTKAKTA